MKSKSEESVEYRLSHTAEGKGVSYHESFDNYPYRRYMWIWEKKQLHELIRPHLVKKNSILDFACGTGRILAELTKMSVNVVGVDVSESMLSVARERVSNSEILNMDITRDNFLEVNRRFQVIVAFRFFLNAQNSLRKEAFNALNPLLEDDGVLIFNNHGNSSHLGLIMQRSIMKFKNFIWPKKNYFIPKKLSKSQIEELLDESGFKITHCVHRNVWPIMSEKRKKDVAKFEKIENWFSEKNFFEKLSRNVIYVCEKK